MTILDQDPSAQIEGTKRYIKLDWDRLGRLALWHSDKADGPWTRVWRPKE